MLHSLILVFIVAVSLISYLYISYFINLNSTVSLVPYDLSLSLFTIALLISSYLLELNIYWIILPGLSLASSAHIAIHWLLLALVYILIHTLIHSLSAINSIVLISIHLSSTLNLIALLLLAITGISASLLVSVYLYLLLELASSYTLYTYLYIAYLHLIWIWGHIEVYVIFMPQLGFSLYHITSTLSLALFDDNAIAVSFINIGAVSSLTWAHHLYSISLFADLINLYTSVSLFIALSTAGKLTVLLTSLLFNHTDYYSTSLGAFALTTLFGGLTGVYITLYAINSTVHFTSIIFGHFHFILSLGFLLTLYTFISTYNYYIPIYYHAILLIFSVPIIVARRVYVSTGTYSAMPLFL